MHAGFEGRAGGPGGLGERSAEEKDSPSDILRREKGQAAVEAGEHLESEKVEGGKSQICCQEAHGAEGGVKGVREGFRDVRLELGEVGRVGEEVKVR